MTLDDLQSAALAPQRWKRVVQRGSVSIEVGVVLFPGMLNRRLIFLSFLLVAVDFFFAGLQAPKHVYYCRY
jgi:hypothetical protein